MAAARPPSRYWQDLTTEDFARLDPEATVVVLPVAAIEQHGPHLPVSVDATLNEGVLRRALELAPDNLALLVLPAMPIGKSDEHIAFPGTLTLSAETLMRLWTEIGASVARAGLRKLVLFNAHGGQPQVMEIVARDLRRQYRMLVATVSWYAFGMPPGLFDPMEEMHGIHGGDIETSMMLHLRPDLVRRDRVANFRSSTLDLAAEYTHANFLGATPIAWLTQDLNADGACGDASRATAAKGAATVAFAAQRLVRLFEEMARFPLDRLKDA